MIILYSHDIDKVSAELIQKQYGGRLVKIKHGDGVLQRPNEDLIIIGGQYTNDTYEYWMNLGYLREIKEADAGFGFVQVFEFQGKKIYALAGWERMDTVTAVSLVMENGLPTTSYARQSMHDMTLITFVFEDGIPQSVLNELGQIETYVNNKLSLYATDKIWWYGVREENQKYKYLEFLVSHGPLELATITMIIILAIILVAVFFTGAIIYDSVKTGNKINLEKNDIVYRQEMSDLGYTPEEANESMGILYGSSDKGWISETADLLKTGTYVLLIGAGIYFTLMYGIPAIKKITKKTKRGKK